MNLFLLNLFLLNRIVLNHIVLNRKVCNLSILYEDNHLLVVDKPAGLLSQADSSKAPDLLSLAKQYIGWRYKKAGKVFLGLVHRLDRDVAGVMLFARTSRAARRLQAQFCKGLVRKTYTALLETSPSPSRGTLENFIKKNSSLRKAVIAAEEEKGAKLARLFYFTVREKLHLPAANLYLPATPIGSAPAVALVRIRPISGRFHQIRFQFSRMGSPILGDRKYGALRFIRGVELALHCSRLRLFHPVTKKALSFKSAVPSSWGLPDGILS